LPRPAPRTGTQIGRARARERGDQRVEVGGATHGMSPRQISAPSISGSSARSRARSELASPRA
jgi:hypothetical protein